MTIQTQDRQLICEDGALLCASVDRPAPEQFERPHGAVVICGALGVPRRFYRGFAAYFAERGYVAIRFDYRGIGDSAVELPGRAIRLEDWGRQDIAAALRLGEKEGLGRVFQIGHSCGGQLLGLAVGREALTGAILVAATLANPKHYPIPDRYGLHLVWRAVIPALSIGVDRFPARRLGLSSADAPSGVMRQWAEWARADDYLFSERFGIDTEAYRQLRIPMLSLAFSDDRFASVQAVRALDGHYPNCGIDARTYSPADANVSSLGHFGYFRPESCKLWETTLDWIWRQPDRTVNRAA